MLKEGEIKIVANNKKASYEYFFLNKYRAGVVLTGTEVKSVRTGKVSMSDAYCYFKDGELWLKNVHISEYANAGNFNHFPKRDRKLLLKKRELKKIEAKLKEKGLTIIPTMVFFNDRQLVKVEVALSKGKKSYDKKNSIREKDAKRDLARTMSDRY
ncbi:MAG: SsrA-binding protein SmpB [Chitinophagales bacterium]